MCGCSDGVVRSGPRQVPEHIMLARLFLGNPSEYSHQLRRLFHYRENENGLVIGAGAVAIGHMPYLCYRGRCSPGNNQ